MIHEGVILKARHQAIQHGAGNVIVDFWRDSLYLYNLLGKVGDDMPVIIGPVTYLVTVYWITCFSSSIGFKPT